MSASAHSHRIDLDKRLRCAKVVKRLQVRKAEEEQDDLYTSQSAHVQRPDFSWSLTKGNPMSADATADQKMPRAATKLAFLVSSEM